MSQCDQFRLFLGALGLAFGRFRGVGNLAKQEGVLHLGLNDVSPYEGDGEFLDVLRLQLKVYSI